MGGGAEKGGRGRDKLGQRESIQVVMFSISRIVEDPTRHDICHKHHKQRLCKIITSRVKFYFMNVFSEYGCEYHFGFW